MLQLTTERTSNQCVADSKYSFWFPRCLLHISKDLQKAGEWERNIGRELYEHSCTESHLIFEIYK